MASMNEARNLGECLVKSLGIEHLRVSNMTIHIPCDDLVTIDITHLVDDEDAGVIEKMMSGLRVEVTDAV